jgi:acetyl-CoA carboxylase carboxyltransferase component
VVIAGARRSDHFRSEDLEYAGWVAETSIDVTAPVAGVLQELRVEPGAHVSQGALLALIEVMKMETEVRSPADGTVDEVCARVGATVGAAELLLRLTVAENHDGHGADKTAPESQAPAERSDLAEVLDRRRRALDQGRPAAVDSRHASGARTARENLADLVDEGSFVEYGLLALAAQRGRRGEDELIERTAADGLIGGTATINAERFGEAAACAVISYDYTVLAGTQGATGHFKKDRLFELIERMRLPVVLFAEGGGGRPGDTDYATGSSLTARAFALWGRLSGLVPRIAIVHGRCFAGNAALAGSADLLIATEDANIGMGGPAMIEGGGLGTHAPEAIGPIDVQTRNGVVDVRVADEAEAVAVARELMGLFQGRTEGWQEPDQSALRDLVPESRRRTYSMQTVIGGLCDTGTVVELRPNFGRGMITALARIEGRPVGIVANDPNHLAGAITSEGSDKAARLMALCEAFELPVISLVDTPGMMVGPEVEETALVRHCSRLFAIGPNLTVPLIGVVVGRGYGLGAQAMVGGSFLEPHLSLAWPTGELGPMGIEGAVRLGMRAELAAIEDDAQREARVTELAAGLREHFRALNVATYFEIDDVIDPAETRSRICHTLAAAPARAWRESERRLPWLDTW